MARMMRAKKKLAQQEAGAATSQATDTHVPPSVTPHEDSGIVYEKYNIMHYYSPMNVDVIICKYGVNE